MADTFTSRMRFRKPEVGVNNNTWGTLLNEDDFDLVDYAFAGRVPITLSNSDYTLSIADGEADESRGAALIFAGTLTADVDVIIPAGQGSKLYAIINNTTGAFTATFKTAGGAGVVVPQDGNTYLFYRDSDALGVKSVRAVMGARLDEQQEFTKSQTVTPFTLTDAATVAIDLSRSNEFELTLGGNRNLGAPTNPKDGMYWSVLVFQDGTGGRTLGYPSGNGYRAPSGAFPTITATAGRASLLTFRYRFNGSVHRHILVSAILDINLT